jgi:tRNA threonylcarbamoyl adenosine modification protein YeaZ
MIHAALDTSLAASFAVVDDGKALASRTLDVRGRNSDEQLVPWLLETLAELSLELSDVRRWTVGTGPGSFSGIRVGISWVLGVCAATGAAVRGVPSSLALASTVTELEVGQNVAVLHDARRKQVILSGYQRQEGGLVAVDTPAVLEPTKIALDDYAAFVTAQDVVRDLMGEVLGDRLRTVPAVNAELLLQVPVAWPTEHAAMVASLEPVYVRPAVFVKPRPVA